MMNFVINIKSFPLYDELTNKNVNFFCTKEWGGILARSFCLTNYYVVANKEKAFLFQIFKKGPFKIGYLNFPTGIGHYSLSKEDLLTLVQLLPSKPQVVNVTCSEFSAFYFISENPLVLPESAITNLQKYEMEFSKKLRKDLRRARSFSTKIVRAYKEDHAKAIFCLYQATVARRKGVVKYSEAYFRELIHGSIKNSNIQVYLAKKEDDIAGFLVLVIDGSVAYYLHGAVEYQYKKYGISDLLLSEAIIYAKQAGCEIFNLMISPVDQPGLVRYKEKWGAKTRYQKNYRIVINRPWGILFSAASQLYKWILYAFYKKK